MCAHHVVGPAEREICRHDSQQIAPWEELHLQRNNSCVVAVIIRSLFNPINIDLCATGLIWAFIGGLYSTVTGSGFILSLCSNVEVASSHLLRKAFRPSFTIRYGVDRSSN